MPNEETSDRPVSTKQSVSLLVYATTLFTVLSAVLFSSGYFFLKGFCSEFGINLWSLDVPAFFFPMFSAPTMSALVNALGGLLVPLVLVILLSGVVVPFFHGVVVVPFLRGVVVRFLRSKALKPQTATTESASIAPAPIVEISTRASAITPESSKEPSGKWSWSLAWQRILQHRLTPFTSWLGAVLSFAMIYGIGMTQFAWVNGQKSARATIGAAYGVQLTLKTGDRPSTDPALQDANAHNRLRILFQTKDLVFLFDERERDFKASHLKSIFIVSRADVSSLRMILR